MGGSRRAFTRLVAVASVLSVIMAATSVASASESSAGQEHLANEVTPSLESLSSESLQGVSSQSSGEASCVHLNPHWHVYLCFDVQYEQGGEKHIAILICLDRTCNQFWTEL